MIGTAPFLYDKSAMNKRISEAQVPWKDSASSLPGKSLVIVRDSGPYLLHLNPYSENSPDLDGPVLYSVDRGNTFTLLDRYPDRTAYFQRTSNPELDDALHHPDALPPKITLSPVEILEGGQITLKVTVRNPGNAPAVVVTLQAGNRVDQRTLQPSASGRGVYETEWTIAPESTVTAGDGRIPVTGDGVVLVTAASGATPSAALNGSVVRERFPFRVQGTTVQMIEPSRKTVVEPVDGVMVPRDVGHLSTLAVDAAAS